MKRAIFIFLAVVFCGLAACGEEGGRARSDVVPIGVDQVDEEDDSTFIQITPGEAVVTTGTRQTFKAESADGTEPAVRWEVQEGESGGSITPDGNYTAPETPGIYHIAAVSLEDPSVRATAEVEVITLPIISVAIEPAALTLPPGGSHHFTALVSASDETAVIWHVAEGEAGGSINQEGDYTAPETPGTYHVVATSATDPTKRAEATVRVFSVEGEAPRFAYVANAVSNDVSVFTVNSQNGLLHRVGSIAAGREPYTIAVDPTGRFVYAGNFGSNDISMYAIDPATGLLTSQGSVPTGVGPYSIAFHPTGRYAYAANENSATDVWIYRIDPNSGILTPLGNVSAGVSPVSIAVDPFGRFAYVANHSSNDLSIFAVDSESGGLSRLGEVDAGNAPSAVAVHPGGAFVYVANYGGGDIWSYRVDPAGRLTKSGEVAAGEHPFSMAVDPSGRFAYVANSATNNVSMYQIDPEGGTLSPLGSIGAGAAPRSISVDSSGRFVYVANMNSSTVSIFAKDTTTGLLTSLAHTPAGRQSRSVRVTGGP
jgi:DNA-binding beta-propeller fold protein YncE